MVLKMAEIIKSKVEEMMASEAVQQRIQHRLKEERAALEDKVVPMLKHILSFCAMTRQSVPKCIRSLGTTIAALKCSMLERCKLCFT